MEFSFDRSNSTQSRDTHSEQPVAGATRAPDDGIDTSNIANERLKKAIERNRARQAERLKNQPQALHEQAPLQTQSVQDQAATNNVSDSTASTEQASLFDRPSAGLSARARVRLRNQDQSQTHAQASTPVTSSAIVTRKGVARPDEAEFTPVKRAPKKVASHISYTTSTSKKKGKQLDSRWQLYLVRSLWVFCGLLILRLLFATGGVRDFYSQKSLYQDRLVELDRIKKENMQMVHEIERMQTDLAYQKKLVRDNLGFIAEDEYLVLFPKEKSIQ